MNPEIIQPCNMEFKNNVLHKCLDALGAVGFTRYRKGNVDWPLNNNFHAWVGLNVGLYDDCVEINPYVGIHSVSIMKFYTALEGRKYSRSVATWAIHMGDLAPLVSKFEFTRKVNIESEAERLSLLYLDIGLPFVKGKASYEELLPMLQERIPMLGGYPERVSSCLYLMGRNEDSRKFSEDFLTQESNYFRGFAVPFLKILSDRK